MQSQSVWQHITDVLKTPRHDLIMNIIIFFVISLSHILAIFPSCVQAICQQQKNVMITFYAWPDNNDGAHIRGGCGRTAAGGTFRLITSLVTLQSMSIIWIHFKQESEPTKTPWRSQQPVGSTTNAKSSMSLIWRNMLATRICVQDAPVWFTTLILNETMEDSDPVYEIGNGVHIDIFIGSNQANGGQRVTDCEDALTPPGNDYSQIIIRKGGGELPSNLPVNSKSSYNNWSPYVLF